MKQNISTFDRVTRLIGGFIALFTGFVVFDHPAMVALSILIGIWFFIEAAVGKCIIFERLGVKKVRDRLSATALLFIGTLWIQIVLGYIWLRSGYSKITGDFNSGWIGMLQQYARGNPHAFWTKYLEVTTGFGDWFPTVWMWSEFLTGAALVASAGILILSRTKQWRKIGVWTAIISLAFSVGLSFKPYFLTGHTSESLAMLFTLIFWISLGLLYIWVAGVFHKLKWPVS